MILSKTTIFAKKSCWQMENPKEERKCESTCNGQATKGAGRMPWHWEPMKDVISCDKLRGAANKH